MQPRDVRPKLEVSEGVKVESEIVCIEPGMGPGFAQLTAYRADGRPFIRMDLPEEAVRLWAPIMERYTLKHDETRITRRLRIEP